MEKPSQQPAFSQKAALSQAAASSDNPSALGPGAAGLSPAAAERLATFRKHAAAAGDRRDCFQVWIALPDEGRFGAAATCIHRRIVLGPPGTVERFATELEALLARFGAPARSVGG